MGYTQLFGKYDLISHDFEVISKLGLTNYDLKQNFGLRDDSFTNLSFPFGGYLLTSSACAVVESKLQNQQIDGNGISDDSLKLWYYMARMLHTLKFPATEEYVNYIKDITGAYSVLDNVYIEYEDAIDIVREASINYVNKISKVILNDINSSDSIKDNINELARYVADSECGVFSPNWGNKVVNIGSITNLVQIISGRNFSKRMKVRMFNALTATSFIVKECVYGLPLTVNVFPHDILDRLSYEGYENVCDVRCSVKDIGKMNSMAQSTIEEINSIMSMSNSVINRAKTLQLLRLLRESEDLGSSSFRFQSRHGNDAWMQYLMRITKAIFRLDHELRNVGEIIHPNCLIHVPGCGNAISTNMQVRSAIMKAQTRGITKGSTDKCNELHELLTDRLLYHHKMIRNMGGYVETIPTWRRLGDNGSMVERINETELRENDQLITQKVSNNSVRYLVTYDTERCEFIFHRVISDVWFDSYN